MSFVIGTAIVVQKDIKNDIDYNFEFNGIIHPYRMRIFFQIVDSYSYEIYIYEVG